MCIRDRYYLNEQLKAIQKELGEIEDGKDETTSLKKSILKAKMPKEVEKKCMSELKKLKNMSPMSAEATVGSHKQLQTAGSQQLQQLAATT